MQVRKRKRQPKSKTQISMAFLARLNGELPDWNNDIPEILKDIEVTEIPLSRAELGDIKNWSAKIESFVTPEFRNSGEYGISR